MELELILTELWPFKVSHFSQLVALWVWSLYNQLLLQFSMYVSQTLLTYCRFEFLMELELILTDVWPIKLTIFGSFFVL